MKIPFTQNKSTNIFIVAFYNVENLFDVYNNSSTHDDDFYLTLKENGRKKGIKKN